MIRKHAGSLARLLIAVGILFVLGLVFGPFSKAVFSEETQGKILIKALPFVLIFVSIILLFIFLVVLLALQFNGNVPQRLYRPVELIIILGILLGIFGLFQPWKLFSYEYGFLVLLISTLSFIVWSHISPRSARLDQDLPPLDSRAHVFGIVAAVIVWGAVTGLFLTMTKPGPPYGMSPTLWEHKREEQKAEIIQQADDEYRTDKIPLSAAISLLPGGIAYFAGREWFASRRRKPSILAPEELRPQPKEPAGLAPG